MWANESLRSLKEIIENNGRLKSYLLEIEA